MYSFVHCDDNADDDNVDDKTLADATKWCDASVIHENYTYLLVHMPETHICLELVESSTGTDV